MKPVLAPPEAIAVGELVLKRWDWEWLDATTAAVRDSLPELSPFLGWATDGYDREAAADYTQRSVDGWAAGEEFNYVILTADAEVAGSIGLMTRLGPGVLEIGYWTRTRFAGRGFMTAAVRALTDVALGLPGIERVAIRYDAANAASARVAAKAGFVEVERHRREPTAPAETEISVLSERRA
ncbi:GNAT family N-acetyltransferase [Actinoplanes sp. N902-109]|uniref:GNAT family N-acetyltransferase n=1 Tax=Actinoplanes sp. (strain N902-109) TaxID=649831 RepID=UPI0005A0D226|nr:GNAT family N-acetyltransferase [Actinoplanes sp. N902-109]